jgi:hypothetical protein
MYLVGLSSLALQANTWRPTTATALHDYLRGDWRLTKSMDYVLGGKTGTFSGGASFAPLQHKGHNALLAYAEEGEMTLGSASFNSYKRLLWDFGGGDCAKVFFDDALEGREDPAMVIEGARFFHDITFTPEGELVFSAHPCGPDVYRGEMSCHSPDAFTLRWVVTGPRKDGDIVSSFSRRDRDRGERSHHKK